MCHMGRRVPLMSIGGAAKYAIMSTKIARFFGRLGLEDSVAPKAVGVCVQGKILMTIGGDPMPDLMKAAGVSPYRAEPYMVMAWHHAKLSAACNASGWRDSACFLRHCVTALHYAKRASEMPQPRKVPPRDPSLEMILRASRSTSLPVRRFPNVLNACLPQQQLFLEC